MGLFFLQQKVIFLSKCKDPFTPKVKYVLCLRLKEMQNHACTVERRSNKAFSCAERMGHLGYFTNKNKKIYSHFCLTESSKVINNIGQ